MQALTTACLTNQLNGVRKLILVWSSQIGDLPQYCFGTFLALIKKKMHICNAVMLIWFPDSNWVIPKQISQFSFEAVEVQNATNKVTFAKSTSSHAFYYTCTNRALGEIPYTVSDNEYGPFAILWSKSAIFRGVWQNIDMQLHPWAPTTLIPHIRAFKRGI